MKRNRFHDYRAFFNGEMYFLDDCILNVLSVNEWEFVYINSEKKPELFNVVVASNTNGGTLMQYTGKNDKNGVKIFEGDIVKESKLCFDFDKPEDEEAFYKDRISYVEYLGHGFWIAAEDFGWEGENLWDWSNLEVIGNIYEHPQLLDKKK